VANSYDSGEFLDLRARVADWRVLIVGNRCAAEVVDQLARVLGIRCTLEAAVGKQRRRQSLIERIEHGSYDAVLVAHGFAQHADTGLLAAACRRAEVHYIAVGKGRFTEIVHAMRVVLVPRARA